MTLRRSVRLDNLSGLPALLEVSVSKRETSWVERAGSSLVLYTTKEA